MRTYYTWKTGNLREVKGEVVREQPLTVFVNGQKFITLLSSPQKLDCLVVGYLWLEKIIGSVADIRRLSVSEVDGRAEVELTGEVELPKERIDPRLFPRIESSLRVEPARLFERMKELYLRAVGYRSSRGIHGAALADADRILSMAEDVGRHNAVDKVVGEALLAGVSLRDRILLNTGRISSEMLLKGARMGVPLVVSRTSPTEMAVSLAEQLGITVVGYLHHDSFNVYAGGSALVLDDPASTPNPPTPA
jgi:FdhD protein